MPAAARYTKEMPHRDSPEGMSQLQEVAKARDLSAAATLRALVREEHRKLQRRAKAAEGNDR